MVVDKYGKTEQISYIENIEKHGTVSYLLPFLLIMVCFVIGQLFKQLLQIMSGEPTVGLSVVSLIRCFPHSHHCFDTLTGTR